MYKKEIVQSKVYRVKSAVHLYLRLIWKLSQQLVGSVSPDFAALALYLALKN
jgi:hypothetical protein